MPRPYNPQQFGLQSGMRFGVYEVIAKLAKGHRPCESEAFVKPAGVAGFASC